MYRYRRATTGLCSATSSLMTACVLVLALAACGGKKEEPAAPQPVTPAVEATEAPTGLDRTAALEVAAEPTRIAREKTHYPPSTAPVLALRPQTALVTLALPPAQPLMDRSVALAARLLPPEAGVEAEVQRWLDLFAEDLGVEDPENFAAVAAAIGLDPERPAAVYLGGERLMEAIAELEAQAAELTADGGEGDDTGLEETGVIDASAFDIAMETPDFALALPCADCPKFVETFLELASDLPDFDPESAVEVEVDGIAIQQYGDTLSYFVNDGWFVAGTAQELVTGVATRFNDPATTQYGTPACPAFAPDEVVALIQADKLGGLTEAGARISGMLGANAIGNILAQVDTGVDSYLESDDPVVLTIRLDDEEFEILARIDTSERPAMFEERGRPGPLAMTAALPEKTPAFIGWRLTDEQKAQALAQVSGGPLPLPGEAREGIGRLINLLGDEITIASTGPGYVPIAPRLAILVRVTDKEDLEDLLSETLAGVGAVFTTTEFNDIEIKTLVPGSVPVLSLSYAVLDDAMLLSIMAADASELMSIIDGIIEGEPSSLFGSLDPPLDPTAPLYSAVVINSEFARSMANTAGMFNPAIRQQTVPLMRFLDTVSELRIIGGIEDNWLFQRVSIKLKPAPAGLPAQPAEGTK